MTLTRPSSQVQQTRAGEGWVKKPLTKSKEEERLDKLLYSMDLSIRKKGRIMISELHKVVALVESLQYCSPTQAVLLFKCCGEVLVDEDKQARTRLLEKSLRLVKNINGMNLDISHYNTLLKVSLRLFSTALISFSSRFIWRTGTWSISQSLWRLLSRKIFNQTE